MPSTTAELLDLLDLEVLEPTEALIGDLKVILGARAVSA